MRNGKYILVKAPDEYPGRKYREKYVYEHILIWWLNTGNLPKEGYDIHHINHNKHDNRIENLEEIAHKDHVVLHNQLKKVELIELKCGQCNKEIFLKPRNFRFKSKNGQQNFFCSKSCGAKFQYSRVV